MSSKSPQGQGRKAEIQPSREADKGKAAANLTKTNKKATRSPPGDGVSTYGSYCGNDDANTTRSPSSYVSYPVKNREGAMRCNGCNDFNIGVNGGRCAACGASTVAGEDAEFWM